MDALSEVLSLPLVISGTGHRPNKLGGYSTMVEGRLLDLAMAALRRHQPDVVISGMALGWDMALAEAALALGLPLVAAVPFAGQELRWPNESQARYRSIMDKAIVKIVSPGGFSGRSMQVRNEWMVDHCHRLLALWDGSSGGTANCIDYARKTNRPAFNLWASWQRYREVSLDSNAPIQTMKPAIG